MEKNYNLYKKLDSTNSTILQFGLFKYSYNEFISNVQLYEEFLSSSELNTVAIVTDDNVDFDTICFMYACMSMSIVPHIIANNIDVNKILNDNNIPVVFTNLKCEYCKPTLNLKNKRQIEKSLKNIEKKEKNSEDYKVALYRKNGKEVLKETITEKELLSYDSNFNSLDNEGRFCMGTLSMPLYLKNVLLYLNSAISKGMHIQFLKNYNSQSNLKKILSLKPSIVTFDETLIIELYIDEKNAAADLSFIKKVIVDELDTKHMSILQQALLSHNCKAEFITKCETKVKEFK